MQNILPSFIGKRKFTSSQLRSRTLKHPNLIQCIAAVSQNDNYSILLEWADGGNLRQFWQDNPRPILGSDEILEVLQQIRAIAEAVGFLHGKDPAIYSDTMSEVHEPKGSSSIPELNLPGDDESDTSDWRHGDLKPDNILRFPKDSMWLGVLKIADLGLTKIHKHATSLRHFPSSQKFATVAYQPPEAIIKSNKATSRLFDMWSIGCVVFEFVVWLLYGWKGLQRFYGTEANEWSQTLFYHIQ